MYAVCRKSARLALDRNVPHHQYSFLLLQEEILPDGGFLFLVIAVFSNGMLPEMQSMYELTVALSMLIACTYLTTLFPSSSLRMGGHLGVVYMYAVSNSAQSLIWRVRANQIFKPLQNGREPLPGIMIYIGVFGIS